MTSLGIAIFVAGIAAVAAIVVAVLRWLWTARNVRLMRCPETGTIAFVGADESVPSSDGKAPELTVWSCDLWPTRKDCARGCLERWNETAPGYRINVEALRTFERP